MFLKSGFGVGFWRGRGTGEGLNIHEKLVWACGIWKEGELIYSK